MEDATNTFKNVRRNASADSSSICSLDSGRSTPVRLGVDDNLSSEDIPHLKEVEYKRSRYDAKGEVLEEDSDEGHLANRSPDSDHQKYAFTWREKEDPRGKITYIEVVIRCKNLRRLLATKLGHVPFIHWNRPHLDFKNPFPAFVSNWDDLQRTAELLSARGGCGTHLKNLMSRIADTKQVQRYLKMRLSGSQDRLVRFTDLELYFQPGELIFANVANQPRAFLLFDGIYPGTNEKIAPEFGLFAWKYGAYFGNHELLRLRLTSHFRFQRHLFRSRSILVENTKIRR